VSVARDRTGVVDAGARSRQQAGTRRMAKVAPSALLAPHTHRGCAAMFRSQETLAVATPQIYVRKHTSKPASISQYTQPENLLEIDSLVVPASVKFRAPDFVHGLVLGAPEVDGRSKPQIQVTQAFQTVDHLLGVELRPSAL
jgi:hypothetical protein